MARGTGGLGVSTDIVEEVRTQFRLQWATLRDMMQKIPDQQWASGEIDYLVPARLIYHILGATDVYANNRGYEEYKPLRRFTLDWKTVPAAQLPDRGQLLKSVDLMEKTVTQWLDGLGDQGLLEDEDSYTWTGDKKLGRAMYLLRHTQGHIGEVNSELRRRGLPRGKW